MSLTNIQRDSLHVAELVNTAQVPWSTTADTYSSDGSVYDAQANVKPTATAIATSGSHYLGLNMSPPTLDRIPYRVKAYVPSDIESVLMLAYAPTSITGTNDALSQFNLIPFNGKFDDVIMIHAHDSTHTYYERPIVFAIGVKNENGNTIRGWLSVQNLAVSPPSFAMGVS
jgi:hypothetical protein